MDKYQVFTVGNEDAGVRLDKYLAGGSIVFTRSKIEQLIEAGRVKVNDKASKPGYRVKSGDVICLQEPEQTTIQLMAQDLPINIIYEDDWLLVVDKPAGLVVHPAPGNREGTLVNALLYHCPGLSRCGQIERPGIVHRLDKDTSGLLMVAKDEITLANLAKQLQSRTVKRLYVAICLGVMVKDSGKICSEIGRHPVDRKRMSTVTRKGKRAVTEYKVLERFPGSTLLELKLETGRTHQIRVHLALVKFPVLGDSQYGGTRKSGAGKRELEAMAALKRQALHAQVLGFVHPGNGQFLEFFSPLPQDMREAVEILRS